MKIINIIKSFFGRKIDEEEVQQETRKITDAPDFIDYDGMGNQGRFPVKNKRQK